MVSSWIKNGAVRPTACPYEDLISSKPQIFLFKFALWVLALGVGAYLVNSESPYFRLLGSITLALMFVHGVELQHQALHGTGAGRRSLDMALGRLLGFPLLISVHHYRDRHLHHHRHVGGAEDAEFFQQTHLTEGGCWARLKNLLMVTHWQRVCCLIWAAWTGGDIGDVYNRKNELPIRRDYTWMGVSAIVLVAVFLLSGWGGLSLLAAFPLAACLHTLLEFPEHWACSKTLSVYENTRTIRAGRLVTWFTNGNNFHVEHHLAPALRPEALRAFHERIATHIVHQNDSYWSFLCELARGGVTNGER